MRKSKLKYLFAGAALATVLAVTAAVSPALAYFTAFTSASGGRTISVEPPKTRLDEVPDGKTKTISIENIGGSPCFVRVKILYPEGVVRLVTCSGERWSYNDDGYYYYGDVLKPTEPYNVTSDLKAEFEIVDTKAQNDFNVIVVEEYTPALIDEDGNYYPNWELAITSDSGTEEGEEVETE